MWVVGVVGEVEQGQQVVGQAEKRAGTLMGRRGVEPMKGNGVLGQKGKA